MLLGFSTRHRQSTLFPTRFQYQYSARTMLRYQQTQQSNDATCTVCVFYNKHLCRRRCRRRLRCDWYSKDPVSCILCMELPRDGTSFVLNGKKRHGFSCRSHGWSNLATQSSIWRSPDSHGSPVVTNMYLMYDTFEWKEETRFQLPIALTVQSRHSIIHLGSPFT